MFVEYASIHVHANIRAHIFRTVIQDFGRIDSFGHRPRGHDVVHDAFVQLIGHAVQTHEFTDTKWKSERACFCHPDTRGAVLPAQHFMIASRRRVHLREDGRHITEDRSVEQGADQHHNAGEDFLVVTVGSHIAEADAGQ